MQILRALVMSSPEELTFVVGRWLRLVAAVLDMVHRPGAKSISSREQTETVTDR
jgi:hypothetical protein